MSDPNNDLKEALKLIDKLNMINTAILTAITAKGSLTLGEYSQIYARTLKEWEKKHAAPNN